MNLNFPVFELNFVHAIILKMERRRYLRQINDPNYPKERYYLCLRVEKYFPFCIGLRENIRESLGGRLCLESYLLKHYRRFCDERSYLSSLKLRVKWIEAVLTHNGYKFK